MTFLPIVERELRVRARQKSTYRFRLGGAALAIGFIIFMLFVAHAAASPQTIGQPMFTTLAWLSFCYCLLDGIRNTADCLSEEKRAGTLGLLFLTDLKGYDVVLGKLMATSLNSFYSVLAIFPPLAIPILVGGVTGGEFWRLVLVLMNTLFFSLCAGLFISSVTREERKAWASTFALLAALTFVPIGFRYVPFAALSWLEALSPGVGFVSLFDASYTANPDRYTTSLLLVHLLSWVFLISASVLFPRVWQEDTPVKRKVTILDRAFAKIGLTPSTGRLRLGSMNPVTWLALTQHGPPSFIWVLIATVGAGGLGSWWVGYNSQPLLGSLFIAAVAVHFVIAARLAALACEFFADARTSGALELLLCTPLPTTQIVDGHREALRRTFGGPVLTLLILEWGIVAGHVLLASGFGPFERVMIPTVTALCLMLLAMDLYAAGEYGMWLGLASKRPAQALTKTMLYVLILPALSVACCFWPVLALVKNLVLINYARDQLRRRFRLVASEQFATAGSESDSRFTPTTKPQNPLPSVLQR